MNHPTYFTTRPSVPGQCAVKKDMTNDRWEDEPITRRDTPVARTERPTVRVPPEPPPSERQQLANALRSLARGLEAGGSVANYRRLIADLAGGES